MIQGKIGVLQRSHIILSVRNQPPTFICMKSDRCLQFFEIKILAQFFFSRKVFDSFAGSYPVIEVNKPSYFVLPLSRRGEKGVPMPKFHDRFDEPLRLTIGLRLEVVGVSETA